MRRSLLDALRFLVCLPLVSGPEHTITPLTVSSEKVFPVDLSSFKILFFPNSTSAIYRTRNDLYVSHDAGRSWKQEESIPARVDVVTLHPFNERMAFVLTLFSLILLGSRQDNVLSTMISSGGVQAAVVQSLVCLADR
ncbi:hypothetical protein B0H17DRAFT_313766 [Mycena rosella]|uniref:Sortilin N-terminal domain-containing protein n=1 Tax=Mycena rosella TaxID=1033263 RepID=A0AAD7CTN0_MYCRO|nr:hypothetical protein B0H17DRAFT_313766 [Mycena rosella]